MRRAALSGCLSSLTALVLAVLAAAPAGAQTTSTTITGMVTDDKGALPGATVVAVNTRSGFRHEAVADADGRYRLSGLAPGSYEIKVSTQGYKEQSRTVEVLVAQTVTVDFRVTFDNVFFENVTVVGQTTERIVDTRNPEVATSITKEQIEQLPQSSRNFLKFAGLAPGIRTADDENANQVFSSGSLNSRQANVYIDGVSQKNDILVGGAFMQDASRGNPFPQNAVQEYKVITQNFKAEYEKASSAVITAVTKSGGNAFHGDLLLFYQGKDMVSLDPVAEERGDEKPDYKRVQTGISVGGPIVRDELHFFASYERNDQDHYASVYRGPQWDAAPADVRSRLEGYAVGQTLSPFVSNLFFGKLSWQPRLGHRLEMSYSGRDESEERGFGDTRVFEGAEDFQVDTSALTAKHTMTVTPNWINEGVVAYQRMQWHPTALFGDTIHENFFGLLDVGGKDSTQDFEQTRWTVRDDFTYLAGDHTLKGGLSYNYMQYDIQKRLWFHPTFNYRSDEAWRFPFEVIYGFGDPRLDFSNHQFGVYAQDDWRLSPRVTVHLGLRWDYESNQNNNDWVTPPGLDDALRAAQRTYTDGTTVRLSDVLDVDRFTTDGNDRGAYLAMLQPRVGVSWDVFGTAKTVVVDSAGRYYDRVQLNDVLDESFRLRWLRYRICFSAAGAAERMPSRDRRLGSEVPEPQRARHARGGEQRRGSGGLPPRQRAGAAEVRPVERGRPTAARQGVAGLGDARRAEGGQRPLVVLRQPTPLRHLQRALGRPDPDPARVPERPDVRDPQPLQGPELPGGEVPRSVRDAGPPVHRGEPVGREPRLHLPEGRADREHLRGGQRRVVRARLRLPAGPRVDPVELRRAAPAGVERHGRPPAPLRTSALVTVGSGYPTRSPTPPRAGTGSGTGGTAPGRTARPIAASTSGSSGARSSGATAC